MSDAAHTRRPVRLPAAAAMTLAALVLAELAVVAAALTRFPPAELLDGYVLTDAAIGASFAVCGTIIALFRPGNAVGWLFLVGGVGYAASAALFCALGLGWVTDASAARIVATIALCAWPPALTCLFGTALLVFPTGRPISRWWWPAIAVTVLWAAAFTFQLLAAGGPVPLAPGVVPFAPRLSAPASAVLDLAAGVLAALGLGSALASLIVRWVRGDVIVRRQLLWVLLAVIVVFVGFYLNIQATGALFALAVIPAAITIAIVRYQLLDIRFVVARAVLYGVLIGLAVAAYLGIILAAEWLLRTQLGLGGSLLATVLVAVAFNPARVWLQRLVDRLFFGTRHDPAVLLRELPATADALDESLESIRRRLKLRGLELDAGGAPLAAAGIPAGGDGGDGIDVARLKLDPELGLELIVGLRAGERVLARADRAALELLGVVLAAAVRAQRHAAEAARSRAEVLGARTDERERLRRELHDGVGPVLTSIGLTTAAARRFLAERPERADELLETVGAEAVQLSTEVRRLIEELRPPVLDDVGLVAAIRRRAEQLSARPDGSRLRIEVDVAAEAGAVERLRPDVESAVYRIASEALTNIARHAAATRASVVLRTRDDALELEVRDDGASQSPWRPGVGLGSMHARAAEFGAVFAAGPTEDGGRVRLRIPAALAAAALAETPPAGEEP